MTAPAVGMIELGVMPTHEVTAMNTGFLHGIGWVLLGVSTLAMARPAHTLTELHDQTQAVLRLVPAGDVAAPAPVGFQHFQVPTGQPSTHRPASSAPSARALETVHLLDVLNNALYQQAEQAGLLTHAPHSHTVAVEGGEVWVLPGLQGETAISSAVRPDAPIPFPAGLDPVLTRWFILLHEAAHTELGELPSPFVYADWTPTVNQAVSDLMFDPGKLGSQSYGVFNETFGDLYGALMLIRLAPDPQAAVRVVNAMHAFRQAERAHRFPLVQDGLFDPHAQVDGLGLLMARLNRTDYLGWIQAATPHQLRQEALAQTSQIVVGWWQTHPEMVQNDFDWARPRPDRLDILQVTETLRLVTYRQNRALSYLLAPQSPPATAQQQTFGSPLFEAQLREDPQWQTSLRRELSPATQAELVAFIQGNPMAQALDAPDFHAWTHADTDVVLTPQVLAEDAQWLSTRYDRMMAALGQATPHGGLANW